MLALTTMLFSCEKSPYNNTTEKGELITKAYPESICEQIVYRISVGSLHIDGLREIVDVECLRKTEKGSYAVLKLDNEKFAYIVIDENDMCTCLYQFRETFPTRAELEETLRATKYFGKFYALSPDVMFYSLSCMNVVACPVQEGYVVAVFFDEELDDRALNSVEFFEDITESFVWGDPNITQILDIDRT